MPPEPLRAVITGAGSGIGRALAIAAARDGAELLLVGRHAEPLEETLRLLEGGPHRCLLGDVTQAMDRRRIAAVAAGRLHFLFNNAGLVASGLLADCDDATLEAMVAVNVTAPLALSRELLPHLKASRGGILFVGSVFGEIGHPYFVAYSATKHALRGAADALRRELAGDGIMVTYAAPRATLTPATERYARLVAPLAMRLDTAEQVGTCLWEAALRRRARIGPPLPERFFLAVQRLLPSLIDLNLGQVRRKIEARTRRPISKTASRGGGEPHRS